MVLFGECGVTHGHQLTEEEGKDGHQGNALNPIILRDRPGEAWVQEGVRCRSQQMNEGRCDNHTRSKVLGDEEYPFGHRGSLMPLREYRKHGP